MSESILIKQATLVNEGKTYISDLLIKDGLIAKIAPNITTREQVREVDATGLHLLPGCIDDQVHFREPGLTHKACIETESAAAVAGGTTSFMEMPNTRPAALTQELLEEKYQIAARDAHANYSFFMGVSNDNAEEVLKCNAKKKDICGVKIFMGSSTGSMLVDNFVTLNRIFSNSELLIATHCESEPIIAANKLKYPDVHEVKYHPLIRDEEACFESSFTAVQLAKQTGARLHILHISTAKELQLFSNMLPLKEKQITNEVCVHHLYFTADDYDRLDTLIQCNPAIKAANNKAALWEALLDDRLDIIATDHAPHTWEEKHAIYPASPSGLPLVQHSLLMMLDYVQEGKISLEKVVQKMAHAPAECFQLSNRGYIREGYAADLVLVDMKGSFTVAKENILYRCGWSPLEGKRFRARIHTTYVNGYPAYENERVYASGKGQRLRFDR